MLRLLLKNQVNISLHLWSGEISFVEEQFLFDSNSSRVIIHYTQRVESRPVTTQGVKSVTYRVKLHSNSLYFFFFYKVCLAMMLHVLHTKDISEEKNKAKSLTFYYLGLEA